MLSDTEIEALLLSLKVASTATLILFPITVALAYLLARKDFKGKIIVETLVFFPLVVPPVVIGYLLLITLAQTSPIGRALDAIGLNPAFTWQGAALASGIMALPLMVRAVRQSFEIEPKIYQEVSATLGASKWRYFTRISLPLALPGIISALILGFARAIGEFGATITFAANIPGITQTLPLALYSEAQTPGGEAGALRLAILCIIPAIAALIISEYLNRRFKARIGLKR